jgi:signal recognition particle receptor subunit beta
MSNKHSRPILILVVGANSVGKTTIISKLTEQNNFKNVTMRYIEATLHSIHPIRFAPNALIFVVNSVSSESTFSKQKNQLFKILSQDATLPLLVIATFQDHPHAHSIAKITEMLDLSSLRNRWLYIQQSCAITSDGVYESLDWLLYCLKEHKERVCGEILIVKPHINITRTAVFIDCTIITLEM